MKIFLVSFIVLSCIIIAGFFVFNKLKKTPVQKINVGDAAPLFSLEDEAGTLRSLDEFRGQKVVLYFYPKDATPGCTTQACGLRDSFDQFKKHDIVVLGVSYDLPESHKKFKEQEKLPFILLSDVDHKVAHMYGTDQHPLGSLYASRTSFLINEQGTVVHIIENATPQTHAQDVLKAFGY